MSLFNLKPEDLGIMRGALAPFAFLYGGVVKSRSLLYSTGIFKRHRLKAPVISIGNLTAGGTGKTSLVIELAHVLVKDGFRVCVLTRGYGRESPRSRVIVSNGKEISTGARAAGDEPRLIAESVPSAFVIVDPDRVSAGKWAIDHLGCNLFLLDDGFQHLRIERDIDIVTIDAMHPWGGGYLLPQGLLREHKAALSRAHIVVITRANQTNGIEKLKEEITGLNSKIRVFASDIQLRSLYELTSVKEISRDDLLKEKAPLGAFCGIGNPRSFFRLLEENGLDIIYAREFNNHHHYSPSDIEDMCLSAKALGVRALVTTAKDAVKFRADNFTLPCYVAMTSMKIDDREALLTEIQRAIEPNRYSD